MFFKNKSHWLYLLPALAVLVVFKIFPIILSFIVSFFKWNMAGPNAFIFFGNYVSVLTDSLFWQSFVNTLYYTLFSLPFSIALSMLFAVLLNSVTRGRTFFRVVYYLPVITSIVAVSVIWKWIYHPRVGLINSFLSVFGITGPAWLGEYRGIFEIAAGRNLPYLLKGPSLALVSLAAMSVWKNLGYDVLIFLTGLQGIPQTYYEAARLDGAGAWRTFRHVTLPLLSPTTFYVFIMSTIGSFQVFAPVWLMTGPPAGGPLDSTNVVVFYLYEKAFQFFKFGAASATAFILFSLLLVLTAVQKKYSEKKVFYG